MKKSKHVPLGRAIMDAIFNNPSEMKIPWYRRRFYRRLATYKSRSKYEPHQNEREKARRMMQRERGILK